MKQFIQNPFTKINFFLTACFTSSLIGAGVMCFGWPKTPEAIAFVDTSAFVIWLILICILFAAMPFAFLYNLVEAKKNTQYRDVC